MPLMRNPFSRRAPNDIITDLNDGPVVAPLSSPTSTFSRRPSSIDIPQQPVEYKMSEIDDNGAFLPPSPPANDKPRFWTTRSTDSTSSSSHRSVMTESDNPFTISRESFDSYRRSFDITARSPVVDHDAPRPRQSIDVARLRLPPPRLRNSHINPPATYPEECFEDVGLNGETARPKRQGMFSRFGGHSAQDGGIIQTARPGSSHFGGQLFGRKRAQSGSTPPPQPPPAEMSRMPQPSSDAASTQRST